MSTVFVVIGSLLVAIRDAEYVLNICVRSQSRRYDDFLADDAVSCRLVFDRRNYGRVKRNRIGVGFLPPDTKEKIVNFSPFFGCKLLTFAGATVNVCAWVIAGAVFQPSVE